jgi:hypothetical protein
MESLVKASPACDFADVTVACDDGHAVRAHRIVLAACSDYFRRVLTDAAELNDGAPPVVVLVGVQPDVLHAILAYVYAGEVLVARDHLADFFR